MLSVAFENFNLWQSVKHSVITHSFIQKLKQLVDLETVQSIRMPAAHTMAWIGVLSKHMKSVHWYMYL